MSFFTNELEKYLENHTSPVNELLVQLRKETFQKTTQPQMLSGDYQGKFLSLFSKLMQPKNILEIGTFTGYSTLCLAEGLAKEGKITTIDRNEELAYLPKKYFEASPYAAQIDFKIGQALDVLDEMKDEVYDLVFIDADKSNYGNYYEKIIDQVRPGGVILVDNVLWYGKVLEIAKPNDKDTLALQQFNQDRMSDDRVEVIILPIRDGISLLRKGF